MKPFNCEETIAMRGCIQIRSNSFKIEITDYVCKQMTDVKL